jgi:hypothetical protein
MGVGFASISRLRIHGGRQEHYGYCNRSGRSVSSERHPPHILPLDIVFENPE